MKNLIIKTIENYNFGKPNSKKAITGSMKELICPDANYQSFCIKLGNCIEKCFNEIVAANEAVKISNDIIIDKRKRQADLYFKYKDKVYYFESKNNLNLDTEKIVEVNTKITDAKVDVKGVLTFRFLSKKEIPSFLLNKYKCDVYGLNDFLNIFGENITTEEYKEIIKSIQKRFENY